MKNIFDLSLVEPQFLAKRCRFKTFQYIPGTCTWDGIKGTFLIISPTVWNRETRDWMNSDSGVQFTKADFRVRTAAGEIFRVYLVVPGDLIPCSYEEWRKVNPDTESFVLGAELSPAHFGKPETLYWATQAELAQLRPNDGTLKEAFGLLGV